MNQACTRVSYGGKVSTIVPTEQKAIPISRMQFHTFGTLNERLFLLLDDMDKPGHVRILYPDIGNTERVPNDTMVRIVDVLITATRATE